MTSVCQTWPARLGRASTNHCEPYTRTLLIACRIISLSSAKTKWHRHVHLQYHYRLMLSPGCDIALQVKAQPDTNISYYKRASFFFWNGSPWIPCYMSPPSYVILHVRCKIPPNPRVYYAKGKRKSPAASRIDKRIIPQTPSASRLASWCTCVKERKPAGTES
jgi:hypothetical protein